MRAVKVIAPFGVGAILFILAYLSSLDVRSGYFPLAMFAVGIGLCLVGAAAIFTDRKEA